MTIYERRRIGCSVYLLEEGLVAKCKGMAGSTCSSWQELWFSNMSTHSKAT